MEFDPINQETFDKVVRHLGKQKEKSVGPTGACKYRGLNGLQCAAGCLISDEDYRLTMEGCSIVTTSRDIFACLGVIIEGERIHLVSSLQNIHDECVVPAWRSKLLKLAKEYNLSPAAVEEAFQ